MSGDGADAGRRTPAWSAWLGANGPLIERLNTSWRLAGPLPPSPSLRQRAAGMVRRLLARLLRPQETFNAALVQYVNATTELGAVFEQERLEVIDEVEAARDELRRYNQASAARERRLDEAVALIARRQEEMRIALGALQQASHDLARRLAAASFPSGQPVAGAGPLPGAAPPRREGHALGHRYVGFEDLYRGSPEAIREGLSVYVPLFAGASDVLDIGCGRGEFLSLLRERGVSARGIDLNQSMVEVCRQHGLDAEAGDALDCLERLPDGALGGLFAAQVVEHLEPDYLSRLIDEAFRVLRPGAVLAFETINPACWFAFFESYIRDITHVRPLHPDTLSFLLAAAGFQQVEIRYRAPYPEHEKLQPVSAAGALADAAETINANVEKLNRLLFTHLDYAAVARRP